MYAALTGATFLLPVELQVVSGAGSGGSSSVRYISKHQPGLPTLT